MFEFEKDRISEIVQYFKDNIEYTQEDIEQLVLKLAQHVRFNDNLVLSQKDKIILLLELYKEMAK